MHFSKFVGGTGEEWWRKLERVFRSCDLTGLLLLLVSSAIRLFLINRPFVPNNEGTATVIPVMHAVNFLRYGPLASGFAGVLNTGLAAKENWTLYAHHPPLGPLLTAVVYWFVGVSEWSTRLVPSVFSIAATLLLYRIIARRYGLRAGFLAGCFYAGAPITIAFGGMPDYVNAHVVFFMLADVEVYMRWRETGKRSWLVWATLLFVMGALTDWPMFYLVPIVAAHYWISGGRSFTRTAALAAVPCAVLYLVNSWMESIEGRRAILYLLETRAIRIGWGTWFREVVLGTIGPLHTWPVVLLAGVYIVAAMVLDVRRKFSRFGQQDFAAVLILIGGLHFVIARQGTGQPWWAAVLTAPLALGAALGLEVLLKPIGVGTWASRFVVIAIVITFIGFSIPQAYVLLRPWPYARSIGYSMKDLGTIIRSISRPDEGVLTSNYFHEPTLWFYADRQLRLDILDVESLDDALAAGPYDLALGYAQKDGPPPHWFVMPPMHRKSLGRLVEVLDARFQRKEIDGFAIYRLK
jgi:4-amino-4-deoxy-L-arabinose transferase-like glycosyltransferase